MNVGTRVRDNRRVFAVPTGSDKGRLHRAPFGAFVYSRFYMPPWAGTDVEAELLAEYLESIAPKIPKNVYEKRR